MIDVMAYLPVHKDWLDKHPNVRCKILIPTDGVQYWWLQISESPTFWVMYDIKYTKNQGTIRHSFWITFDDHGFTDVMFNLW